MSLASGTRLGGKIVGAVGAGGMGEVYRGRDSKLDRLVALKMLRSSVAKDAVEIRGTQFDDSPLRC